MTTTYHVTVVDPNGETREYDDSTMQRNVEEYQATQAERYDKFPTTEEASQAVAYMLYGPDHDDKSPGHWEVKATR